MSGGERPIGEVVRMEMEGGQMVREARVPVLGRITQPTEADRILINVGCPGHPLAILPSGRIAVVKSLYMLYVYRQNGQAGMVVNRVDPFQYEQMMLTELEMEAVMKWAHKMVVEDIGRFTPTDGGWCWWRK